MPIDMFTRTKRTRRALHRRFTQKTGAVDSNDVQRSSHPIQAIVLILINTAILAVAWYYLA